MGKNNNIQKLWIVTAILFIAFFGILYITKIYIDWRSKPTNVSSNYSDWNSVEKLIQDKEDKKSNNYTFVKLQGTPNRNWVGKYLNIRFDNSGGKSISDKTKIVKLLDYSEDSEGYKYFMVKDMTDGYLNEIYIFWFGNDGGKNGFGPNIESWKEAIPK